MKRHYDEDCIKNLLKKTLNIKREDLVNISIWADLIVGFPWETEEDFLKTYSLVENFNISKIHAFPFSDHSIAEQVPASFFANQVNEKTKKDRLERLLNIGEKVRNNFILSQKWKILNVLIEFEKDWIFKWWSENYILCNNENFEIISWNIKKNEIVIWKIK